MAKELASFLRKFWYFLGEKEIMNRLLTGTFSIDSDL